MTAHGSNAINLIEEEQCLVQRLQQEILQTTYQPMMAISKVKAEVVTSPALESSKTNLDEERRGRCRHRVDWHKQRVPELAVHEERAIKMSTETSE